METGPEKPPAGKDRVGGADLLDPVDKEGHETLNVISEADNFNRWMFDVVSPWVRGRALETGSGIGNISSLLVARFPEVWLSDVSDNYLQILRSRFAKGVHILQLDLVDPAFDEKFAHLFGSFDTVIALNVIEHIPEDGVAVGNCRKLLKKGGRFVVLVPAYRGLYNRFDQELGHCRRYTKKGLKRLLQPYLTVAHAQYFNLAGITGWFFSGTVLKKKIIPSSQMRLFNPLVPVFRLLDKMVFYRVGLSVMAVAVREEEGSDRPYF